MTNLNRDALKGSGWSLGKFFTNDTAHDLIALMPEDHRHENYVHIAITHDCSVINPCLQNEPLLEYLSVQPINSENGQFTNARNIRRLHFQVEVRGELKWYEASMGLRGFIKRAPIASCEPDNNFSLTEESLLILKRWLANRYISQTFPDRFNELTSPLVRDSKAPLIRAFNSDVGKACNSIFISLTPSNKDIGADESYEVVLVLVFRTEVAEQIGRTEMESFGEQIKGLINTINGLDPVEVFALADSDITYDQIVKMTRWQLDYVSIKDNVEILTVEHS